ncbi:MAG: hypothetical protein ACLRIL_08660 [Fusicatenibacter saccharivorans]
MKNWIQIAADFETFLKEHRIAEDYGDIMLFHLVIGAMYLAKEEMTYRGKRFGLEKLSEAVWRRSVCPENADFWKLSALCDKN